MINSTQQKGAALLTALFIMILVMIAAVGMAIHLHILIRQTELLQTNEQLYNAMSAPKTWARNLLISNAQAENNGYIPDQMPQTFPSFNNNNITIQGNLTDAQAKLNLNDLLNPSYAQSFINLVTQVVPNTSIVTATSIASAIQNWLSYGKPQNNNNNPPVLNGMPNHPFSDLSELANIPELTPKILQRLLPYICVLPGQTAININTASKAIIMTLGNGLSSSQADIIINLRTTLHGFNSLGQLSNNPAITGLNLPSDELTINSNFFQLNSMAASSEQALESIAILERVINNKQIQIVLLNEKLN